MKITPPPESDTRRYGFVFRCKVDGKWCTLLSERLEESWSNAKEIADPDSVYATLGVDQLSIVQVWRNSEHVTIKDLVTLTIDCDGDSTTIAAAIRAGTVLEIAEKGLQDFLAKQKSPKALKNLHGQDTYIYDSWLKERFIPRIPGEGDPTIITDPKAITEMLVKVCLLNYDREQEDLSFERYDSAQQKFVKLDRNAPDQVKMREECKVRMEDSLRDFLAPLQEGDQVWQFESSQGSWLSMAGRAGYVLLRKGAVVNLYITRMS